ncbi:MAG: hypothetical protein UV83_C0001G0156 [candidate division WWE3 bacterium GW2011_GWE2_43_18]|nr:MAG: hypothetical protein UU91_C0003G0018 [candidate division WWE3 bacterium GW2011_GWB1_42_117]KKS55285.1 MAG: hypothetical protein UV21_C0002G0159 [candidate division WWE3 bacterium GW2011_GWD2_42_34]KKT05838.1 MAG: hypothetical protein UV83_C0001G0156 [candidate division WWE3 bacterium GW2011_GWE2_43_18]KKT07272.1 MAG: hypothetical protein UV84_C0001G0108 [candidate division WWE3 bacterium GW2011_GWF2_43_18]KKT09080.1 MAG: hypothetical protein UV87_C0001G0125 [candidate division WWE3 bact
MFRFLTVVLMGTFAFFVIEKAYQLMSSPGGSAAGLVAVVILGAAFLIAIVGFLSQTKKEQKTNIPTMARKPRK